MPKKIDPNVAEAVMLKAGLKPFEPYKNSASKWKCECLKCGSVVFPTHNTTKLYGSGCRFCGYRRASLKRLIPEKKAILIMLDAGLKPLEPYRTSNSKWKSECLRCGKIVSPVLSTVKGGGSCEYCAGKKVDAEDTVAKMLKANVKPLDPYKSAKTRWKCICLQCNKIVYPSYDSVSRGNGACKYCAKGQFVDPEDAFKLMIKSGLKPLESYKGSGVRWKCIHLPCNQVVHPTYASIQQGHGGCIHCAGVAKKSDAYARKTMLKAKLEPLEAYSDAKTKWKCKCLRCNKIVFPTYTSIQSGGSGCIYCAKGQYVDPEDAIKLMTEHGFTPLEPYPGTNLNWKCIHVKCGNIVHPKHATIRQGKGGCRTCAVSGFQYAKESYLYLITHNQFGAHKVGIANKSNVKSTDRLYRHKQEGWETIEVWNFDDGYAVARIESHIFTIIRKDMAIPQYLIKGQMKFGGQTETMDANLISIPMIKKIIRKSIRSVLNDKL